MSEKIIPIATDQAQRYAQASGDHNPIHLDAEFARSVGLPGVILHGLCTLSMLSHPLMSEIGGPDQLRKIKVRFSQPVFPGDQLTLQTEKFSDSNSPGHLKIQCLNQKAEAVISHGLAEFGPCGETPAGQIPDLQPAEEHWIKPNEIKDFLSATDAPEDLYTNCPPLFAAVFALKPFLKPLFEKLQKPGQPLIRIIHANQEFEFYQPIFTNQRVHTRGMIEREAKKGGQNFIYFLTETTDDKQNLLVFGRSLVIVLDSP